jgi:hypothetical protein
VRRRIVAAASASAAAVGVTLASLVSPWVVGGCQTHQCDPTWVAMGTIASPAAGGVGTASLSADGSQILWESSPLYGQWLDYEGNQSLEFTFPPSLPDPFACQPWPAPTDPPAVWVAQYGSDAGSDGITVGSGQDAIITQVRGSNADGTPGGFVLTNGSCQPYNVWIQARFTLPATTCPDGGADSGADDGEPE